MIGNRHLGAVATLVVVDGTPDQALGALQGVAPVEAVVGGAHRAGDLAGGDDLGVVRAGDLGKARHAALHVGDHHFDGAGDDGQFLLQEVPRDRNAVTHENLVGGATDPGERHAFRTGILCRFHDLRIPRGDSQHLRYHRLVPVHHDVDGVLPEHAQVDLAADRLRRAEQDVTDDRRDARATPAVGERGAQRVGQQAPIVMVDAHGGAVQALDHGSVDPGRFETAVPPHPLALERRESECGERFALAGELVDHPQGEVARNLLLAALGFFDAVSAGVPSQRPLVSDLVAAALALGDLQEQEGQVPPVVRMGGDAGGDLAKVVPGDHRIGVRAADASGRLRRDPARPHVTDATAETALAEAALSFLSVHAVEAGAGAFGIGLPQQLDRGRIRDPLLRPPPLDALRHPASSHQVSGQARLRRSEPVPQSVSAG